MAVRHAGVAVTLLVTLAILSACGTPTSPAPPRAQSSVRIASLKGPTTMGLVGLMSDAESGRSRHDYRVTMLGTPDEIVPRVVRGEVDFSAISAAWEAEGLLGLPQFHAPEFHVSLIGLFVPAIATISSATAIS